MRREIAVEDMPVLIHLLILFEIIAEIREMKIAGRGIVLQVL